MIYLSFPKSYNYIPTKIPLKSSISEGFWFSLSKAYIHIEDWRNRPLQGGRYPYVYVDGIYLRRNWGGEYENVAILVEIAVTEDGFREVLGAAEGM